MIFRIEHGAQLSIGLLLGPSRVAIRVQHARFSGSRSPSPSDGNHSTLDDQFRLEGAPRQALPPARRRPRPCRRAGDFAPQALKVKTAAAHAPATSSKKVGPESRSHESSSGTATTRTAGPAPMRSVRRMRRIDQHGQRLESGDGLRHARVIAAGALDMSMPDRIALQLAHPASGVRGPFGRASKSLGQRASGRSTLFQ